ncbi:hypothetical protein ZHAS_00019391 [Anopheles sinensis]|uniref:Uncharacterized protein n=1 Tax=Anopheles sinensis TaxID=74873 RepID=A0A084WM90_ANOSI|nr:hypothetical protein ZHAS_00019391 [Anopheles sinensis]
MQHCPAWSGSSRTYPPYPNELLWLHRHAVLCRPANDANRVTSNRKRRRDRQSPDRSGTVGAGSGGRGVCVCGR